jgi:hypothetical protein
MVAMTWRDIRSRNETRCLKLLEKSELLVTDDLAWEDVPKFKIADGDLYTLIYMRDVEGFTSRGFAGLSEHPATWRDPLVARFLRLWHAEETEHARALARFLEVYGEEREAPIPALQPAPPPIASTSERWTVALTRPVGHIVTAAHMVWGATNELITMNGYRLMAQRTEHRVLAELLKRIASQEARHFSFYALQGEWRLARSRVARVAVRTMLQRNWTPVGVGADYKQPEEFDRALMNVLEDATSANSERVVSRMDATIGALPGLEGLDLFRGVVDTAFSRAA